MNRNFTEKFLSWAWSQPKPTFTTGLLYRQYCRLARVDEGTESDIRFRGFIGRLSSKGICVSLFHGCRVFPDSDVHMKLWEYSEAPWVILQDGLRNNGHISNRGGFDVLYENGNIDIPPVAPVLFSDGTSFFRVSRKLRRQDGESLLIQAYVIPRYGAKSSQGIIEKGIEGLPYRESLPYRAYEEAEWLMRSKYGIKTGIVKQKHLLDKAWETYDIWDLLRV